MIVFDLRCENHHVFEGWFGSSDDFESQLERGLLTCPVCGVAEITKAVMAPSVGAKSNQKMASDIVTAPSQIDAQQPAIDARPSEFEKPPTPSVSEMKSMLSRLAKVQEKALESSRWVGQDFTDTARAMHYGEVDTVPVHGEATLNDAKELLEEGINIAPLPLPIRRPDQEN